MKDLRQKGLRRTTQREQLLAFIGSAKTPLSAAKIAEALEGKINKVTVYRSLEQLVEAGVVRRLELGGRAKQYELDYGDDHHHLICERCGKIEKVDLCHVSDMEKKVLQSSKDFGEVTRHSLEFYGVCKSCKKKMRG